MKFQKKTFLYFLEFSEFTYSNKLKKTEKICYDFVIIYSSEV